MIFKKKILGVILCRSDSRRLKNKIFRKVNNKPILEILIINLKNIKYLDNLVIAYPKNDPKEKLIKKLAKKYSVQTYYGKKNNVLDRLIKSSKNFKYDFLLRLNADNPFMSRKILKLSLKNMIKGKFDLSTYAFSKTIPFGLGTVIFKKTTLNRIQKATKDRKYLEHVENYCFVKRKLFKIHNQEIKNNVFYFLNCSIDEPGDLVRVKKIFKSNFKDGLIQVNSYAKKMSYEDKAKEMKVDILKKIKNKNKYN